MADLDNWTIWFVVPRLERQGGYETQAAALAQALLERGVPLRILTDSPADHLAALPPTVRVRCECLTGSVLGLARAFHRRFRRARGAGPVVVHGHALYRFSALALWTAQRSGAVTVLKLPTEQDAELLFESPRLALRLFRPALRRVSLLACPSAALVAEVGARAPAVFVPNGVDTARFCPGPSPVRLPFAKSVLFVGRQVARKGGDVLVRAFAAARPSLPRGAGLVFVGEGDQQEAWRQLAREHGLGAATLFCGAVDRPEDYYRVADAFVLPSAYEGMPNALLEAMACARPCLATRIGGVTDLLGGRFEAQMFPAGDHGALAGRLPSLFGPGAEPLGAALRAHAIEHFSLDAVARRWIEIYRELGGVA